MQAFVALGANLGDSASTVREAAQALAGIAGTRLVRVSPLYASAPFEASGPDFVNAVAEIDTELPPLALLDALQALENHHGRERPYRNAPRTLDLDLLLYGDQRVSTPRLEVPHPRLRERAFVLLPLADLAPARVDAADLARVASQPIRRLEEPSP